MGLRWESRFIAPMKEQDQILQRINDRREAIAHRRREIARVIEVAQSEDADLIREDYELETMTRRLPVFFANAAREPQAIGDMAANIVASVEPEQPRTKRKPEHLPSILEMADDALRHFEQQGTPWATARDIAKHMRATRWPEAKPDFIQGQLWRAAKRGDLIKKGSCYGRKDCPHEKGLATEAARPSQSNGAIGSNPIGT